MTFADLGLSDQLLRAVEDSGYTDPTPIQRAAIPPVLMGKDLVGIAQTGTGKTAAFVLPMIDILGTGPQPRAMMPRSLILEPTRELAAQVSENFEKYGKYQKLSMALLIGGVQMGDQIKALQKRRRRADRHAGAADGPVRPRQDPADRLRVAGDRRGRPHARHGLHPRHRGNLLEAAEERARPCCSRRRCRRRSRSSPPSSSTIRKRVEVARPGDRQRQYRAAADRGDAPTRSATLLRELLRDDEVRNAIIFCNRKTTVRELATSLKRSGFAVGQIQGDMEQSDRIAEFDRFKRDEINILVASDVAARGLDVKGVSHVDQFRRAVAARRLHPPHRPHRPRRRDRHRDHARDPRGCRGGRGDREADRRQDRARVGDAAEAKPPAEAAPQPEAEAAAARAKARAAPRAGRRARSRRGDARRRRSESRAAPQALPPQADAPEPQAKPSPVVEDIATNGTARCPASCRSAPARSHR